MSNNSIVILVCGLYFVAIICVGIYASRKNKKASDFLLAGRSMGVTVTAIMLAAVQIGVGIVLSGATNGYNGGVWFGIYYAFGCGGGLILAGLLTTKRLREEDGYVPLDFFAQRYGDSRGVRFWAWLSNVPSLLGIFIAQVLACGGILSGFGLPFHWGVVITGIGILIYCTFGGRLGIAITNVIQTTIIMIGIPVLFLAVLVKFLAAGGTLGEIYLTPLIPAGMFTKFIYLVLPFLLSISVSYDAYSCIQSSKDAKTASKGCIWGGIIVIVVGLFCSSIGAMCVRLFPGVTDGIFTIAATSVLNPVMAGIVIAAILAAAMSSANGVILSLGSSFARDFYNKFLHPEVDNLDELPLSKKISQWTVLGGSLVGILFAFKMTDILDAMIIFNYPYMGSLLVPLLGGLLWKKATRKGAFSAAVAGGIIGVVAFLFGIPGPLNGMVNVDLALLFAYLVSAVTLYMVSMSDKQGQQDNITRENARQKVLATKQQAQ